MACVPKMKILKRHVRGVVIDLVARKGNKIPSPNVLEMEECRPHQRLRWKRPVAIVKKKQEKMGVWRSALRKIFSGHPSITSENALLEHQRTLLSSLIFVL